MSDGELKPVAWVVIECGCRAPDDCEDYEEFISAEAFDKNASHYSRYVEHGRAFPLYMEPHSAPITREQVNEWCKAEGMAVVPDTMPAKLRHRFRCEGYQVRECEKLYGLLINAAQEDG
jgi:hypothetical protein